MVARVLDQVVQLFVFFSKHTQDESGFAMRSFMEVYLSQNFSRETVDKYMSNYDRGVDRNPSLNRENLKSHETDLDYLSTICEEINSQLEIGQKTKIAIHLIEFFNYLKSYTTGNSDVEELIRFTLTRLRISEEAFSNLLAFIQGQIHLIPNKMNCVVASGIELKLSHGLKTHFVPHFGGKLYFYFIPEAKLFVLYLDANDELELAGQPLIKRRIYYFEKRDSIRGKQIHPIYYSSILSHFLNQGITNITFSAENISYHFPNSEAGIQNVSLVARSGELVAVMGGSGSGKTTCINILSGTIKPESGVVKINGIDVFANKKVLEGLIGFVPQDDLLFEELTVEQNLFFNASLCNGNLSKPEIDQLVDETLKMLKIFEIKHLIVGNPLNKVISGGQRKRLNIALELIREPHILFLDEPTSGLSSADSEHLIDLLKEIAIRGKIVILNIHQPSSDIYKLFDKLLILDNFGYPVFFGNQIDAIVYLKNNLELADADRSECTSCGYINPEQIFKLVETPKLDSEGNEMAERLLSPKNWHNLYKEIESVKVHPTVNDSKLPQSNLHIPNRFKQFKLFSHRNILSKFSDKQYLAIGLIEAPLLGLILGFLTRYTDPISNRYTFSENENIPAFLFMAILVSLFLGMIISAEEIIKDRKILKREAFLNLSKVSFLNAKMAFLFVLSAIQMGSFLLVSCSILGIKDLFWSYFTILWVTSCFANIVGLLLSSVLKSKVAIYVSIPFVLIPQILLAGTIVKFDKLNGLISSQQYVPVIGDLMVSRWAYEALAVNQFVDNPYYREIYPFDKERAEATYIANFFVSELENQLGGLLSTKNSDNKVEQAGVVRWGFGYLAKLYPSIAGSELGSKLVDNPKQAYAYLKRVKNQAVNEINKATQNKDAYLSKFAKNDIIVKKEDYYNNKLASILIANDEINKIFPYNGTLLRKFQPIYFTPTNHFGRSHFYTPQKVLGKYQISTYLFNIVVIIFMSVFVYVVLLTINFDSLPKNQQNIMNIRNIFKK